jgi:hypothetical protein
MGSNAGTVSRWSAKLNSDGSWHLWSVHGAWGSTRGPPAVPQD